MLVVLPLLTGGALHRVLRQFGIRLPSSLSGGGGKCMHSRLGFVSTICICYAYPNNAR